MFNVIIMSAIAGCAGTGLGGVVGCVIKGNARTMSAVLGFAGGVMLGVVLFDLIPESIELSNLWITLISVIAGVVTVYALGDVLYKRAESRSASCADGDRERYLFTGMLMFTSIALHDFPEGLIIGAGEAASAGLVHTLLIALHNIPEGTAIAVPMKRGGLKTHKVIFYSMLSGAPSLFGAILGYALGGVHVVITAVCLSVSAGAMLAAVFLELFPSVNENNAEKSTYSAMMIIAGILATLIMVVVLEG